MASQSVSCLAWIFIFCYLHAVLSVSDADFQAVVKRLEILENKDKTNRQIIGGLQEQMLIQATTIEQLQQELATNSVTITSLANTVTTLKEQILSLSDKVSTLEEEKQGPRPQYEFESFPDYSNDTVNDLGKSIVKGAEHFAKQLLVETMKERQEESVAKRLIVDPEVPVAFHAVISVHDINNVGHNQNIVFDKIMLNLGAGYHSQHGVFIAPATGLYLFSTTILSFVDPVSEFQVEIVKNGSVLGRVFTHGDSGREDQSAMTVVVQLATNDEVWVRQTQGTRVYGNYYTSFAGILLLPQ